MKEIVIKAVISVLATAVIGFIVAKVKEIARKQKATDEGLQSLLRAEIIRTYEKSIDRGFCPIYSKEAFEHCYRAYKDLNGNGVVDEIFKQTMSLPTSKPKEARNEK